MIRIHETTIIQAPIERCFELSRSIEVHLLANIHSGEQTVAVEGISSGLQALGEQVTWRARHFGVWQELTSEVTRLEFPSLLQITMLRGAFRSMQADHHFRGLPGGATELVDDFRIAAPLPVLGPIAETLFLRRYMLALVRERNLVIKQVAESDAWQRYLPAPAAPAFEASR